MGRDDVAGREAEVPQVLEILGRGGPRLRRPALGSHRVEVGAGSGLPRVGLLSRHTEEPVAAPSLRRPGLAPGPGRVLVHADRHRAVGPGQTQVGIDEPGVDGLPSEVPDPGIRGWGDLGADRCDTSVPDHDGRVGEDAAGLGVDPGAHQGVDSRGRRAEPGGLEGFGRLTHPGQSKNPHDPAHPTHAHGTTLRGSVVKSRHGPAPIARDRELRPPPGHQCRVGRGSQHSRNLPGVRHHDAMGTDEAGTT